jgi:hypothetical protein
VTFIPSPRLLSSSGSRPSADESIRKTLKKQRPPRTRLPQ